MMNSNGPRILHCMHAEKFIDPFIDFMERNFPVTDHKYLIREVPNYKVKDRPNAILLPRRSSSVRRIMTYVMEMNRAEKIFLHSIIHRGLMLLLFVQPWLMRKTHLLMWGNELYYHLRRVEGWKGAVQQYLLSWIIRRSAVLVTFLDQDYEKAVSWFGAKGRYGRCILYPSNVCPEIAIQEKKNSVEMTILVGNSATATNRHESIFRDLKEVWTPGMRIYCPLSYGDPEYGNRVEQVGKDIFGSDFLPLRKFMPLHDYNRILNSVDVVVFGHNRAQAMGNLVSLIAMKKKIYLNPETSQWALMKSLGVVVNDVNDLSDIKSMNESDLCRNSEIISRYFSEKNLAEQYAYLFEAKDPIGVGR